MKARRWHIQPRGVFITLEEQNQSLQKLVRPTGWLCNHGNSLRLALKHSGLALMTNANDEVWRKGLLVFMMRIMDHFYERRVGHAFLFFSPPVQGELKGWGEAPRGGRGVNADTPRQSKIGSNYSKSWGWLKVLALKRYWTAAVGCDPNMILTVHTWESGSNHNVAVDGVAVQHKVLIWGYLHKEPAQGLVSLKKRSNVALSSTDVKWLYATDVIWLQNELWHSESHRGINVLCVSLVCGND